MILTLANGNVNCTGVLSSNYIFLNGAMQWIDYGPNSGSLSNFLNSYPYDPRDLVCIERYIGYRFIKSNSFSKRVWYGNSSLRDCIDTFLGW